MKNPNTLKWSDLKTGIFFLLGLGFTAYLGLVISKNSSLFTGTTTVKILSRDVQGLAENNFVSVSGKKIGTVSKLDFVNEHDSLFVVAELRLRNEYASLVTKDAKAEIRSLGVLGDKYVDITTGNGKPVQNGDFIALETKDGVGELTGNATKMLVKINELLDKINSGKGVAGKLISDEKTGTEFTETLSSLKTASAELAALSRKASNGNGLLPKLINDGKFAKNTEETMIHLNQAAEKTESLMAKLESDRGTFGQLHSNPELYNNLTETLSSLDSLLIDVRKNPKRYVKFSVF